MNTKLFRVFGALGLVLMLSSQLAYAAFSPEQVKAVYLYRIVSFIHWQNEDRMSSINICVPDSDEIRSIMSEIAEGKTVRNKPIHITSQGCDVVFISQRTNLTMLKTMPKNTVTVSDVLRFTDYGGAVELVTKAGKIKPKVNLGNVGSYRISSNFLRVSDVEGELK
jgi:hypothetical protein